MSEVRLEPGMSIDAALRLLKKDIDRSGLFAEIRSRQYYLPPSARRRNKSRIARKRIEK